MKNVLLIDIGAGPLPVVTPVPARQSAWFPVLHTAPPLPTPPNVHTTAVADGILVEWDAVPIDGVIYVVSRAPAEAGPYVIVHRTTGLRYLHTDNTGEPSWFRVSIELNGRESAPSVPVVETPVDVTDAIAGSDQAAADALAAALAADAKAAQEIIDRQAADALLAAEQAVLRSQVGDILQADVHSTAKTYPKGDLVQSGSPAKLYRALQNVPAGIAISNAAYWELIGNYASLGEAVSANVALSMATASDLEAVSQTVTRHESRMPTGTGKLSTEARVTGVESAAATATGAVSNRVGVVEVRMPTGTDKLANEARVVTAENASVGRDSALSGRVGTVEVRMPSGTDKLANEARVATAEQAAASAAGANAAAITQVSAGLTGSGNLMTNPSFDGGLGNMARSGDANWEPLTINRAAASNRPVGINTIGRSSVAGATVAAGDFREAIDLDWVPCEPNAWHIASVYAACHRAESICYVRCYNASGELVEIVTLPAVTVASPGGTSLAGWARPFARFKTSATTVSLEFRYRAIGTGQSAPYCWWLRPMIEQTGEAQTAPSPWAPSANGKASTVVTQAIRADVDSVTGKVNSSYTLAMNANGKFSGVKFGNDGTVSNAEFLFDNFNFVTADGSFFIGGGRTINRFGGFMTVSGRPFGVNNEFTEWYGPDIDIAACARESALSFKTVSGIPYFGGILTKEAQSRTASSAGFGNGTLACPSHPSNGGRKKINITLSRSNNGYLAGNVAPAGGGIGSAFTATFTLQRKIGAGAWTTIKTHTSNSSVQGSAAYDSEFGSTFFSASGSGGLTFEDTDSTVATVQYQVIYTASGGPPAYSSSDAGTPVNRQASQSTKITVIEDEPF